MSTIKQLWHVAKTQDTLNAVKKLSASVDASAVFNDINTHFMTCNWSLRYELYRELSKMNEQEFNIALKIHGLKIVYNNDTESLCIRPK